MIEVKRGKRHVIAMIMNEPVNDVHGVVQCVVGHCEAYMPIMDGPDEESPAKQVESFLDEHDCDPKRFATQRN